MPIIPFPFLIAMQNHRHAAPRRVKNFPVVPPNADESKCVTKVTDLRRTPQGRVLLVLIDKAILRTSMPCNNYPCNVEEIECNPTGRSRPQKRKVDSAGETRKARSHIRGRRPPNKH